MRTQQVYCVWVLFAWSTTAIPTNVSMTGATGKLPVETKDPTSAARKGAGTTDISTGDGPTNGPGAAITGAQNSQNTTRPSHGASEAMHGNAFLVD
jgi:hypothetical protein